MGASPTGVGPKGFGPMGFSHMCARCGTMTPGIPVGGLCRDCVQSVARRAGRIARWVAMGTTVPLAVYVTLTLPATAKARILGAAAVIAWYVITARVARRIAWEWLT
jgi:hypothetical protein